MSENQIKSNTKNSESYNWLNFPNPKDFTL